VCYQRFNVAANEALTLSWLEASQALTLSDNDGTVFLSMYGVLEDATSPSQLTYVPMWTRAQSALCVCIFCLIFLLCHRPHTSMSSRGCAVVCVMSSRACAL
jgi:hypothetical protein